MNLIEYILNDRGKRNILLICNGGSGKTYQFYYAYKSLLNIEKCIPIFVPMNQFDGHDPYYIENYIIENYLEKIDTDSVEANRNILKKMFEAGSYNYYIFIDAVNETSVNSCRIYNEIRKLSEIKNVRLIVSSKTDSNILYDFDKITVKKIDESILKKSISNYINLKPLLKKLIKRPFYFKKYISIDDEKKRDTTNSVELLSFYYDWIIKKMQDSLDNIDYQEFCGELLKKFIPEFAYDQMSSSSYLAFDKEYFIQRWNEFKSRRGITFDKSFIKTLEEMAIIRSVDVETFVFQHQNEYTYFVAYYIFHSIQKNGDKILIDVTDDNILTMLGEMMNEDSFFSENVLNELKSPIELRLDQYRNKHDDISAQIVGKYIDIMKLSRNNYLQGTDFSELDMTKSRLYCKSHSNYWNQENPILDIRNSKFCKSILTRYSFEAPELSDVIRFVYVNEIEGYIIVSDLKTMIVILDDHLRTIGVLKFESYLDTYINIYTSKVVVQNIIYEGKDKEKSFELPSKNFEDELILFYSNVDKEFHIESPDRVIREEIKSYKILGEESIYVFTVKMDNSNWTIEVSLQDITIRNKQKKYTESILLFQYVKYNINTVENIYLSTGIFEFTNEQSIPGDIYIEKLLTGRIYDTTEKRNKLLYNHKRSWGRCALDDRVEIDYYPIVYCGAEWYITAYSIELDGHRAVAMVIIPQVFERRKMYELNFVNIAAKVFGKRLLIYSYNHILIGDLNNMTYYNDHPEGRIRTIIHIPFKDIQLTNKECIYCKIIDDTICVLYRHEHNFGFWKYDLTKKETVMDTILNIFLPIDFYSYIANKRTKRAECDIEISRDCIYIIYEGNLHIYYIDYNCSFTVRESHIADSYRLLSYSDGIIGVNINGDIIKIKISTLLNEEEMKNIGSVEGMIIDGKFVKGTISDIFNRLLRNDELSELLAEPCLFFEEEFVARYLNNVDIRNCNFDGAVYIDEESNESEVPPEILSNT